MVWYQVKTSEERWHKDTLDLQYFEKKTSIKIGIHGITKNGPCKGSWVCPNQKLSFWSTSHENHPNEVNMKTDSNNQDYKICEICEQYEEWEGCGTRDVVDFNPETDMATVYHMGNHTCWSKIGTEEPKAFIESRQEKCKGTGTYAAIENIADNVWSDYIECAEQDAGNWTNIRFAQRGINEQNPFHGEHHNSFDAVCILRRKTDKKTNSTSIESTMELVTTHLTTSIRHQST